MVLFVFRFGFVVEEAPVSGLVFGSGGFGLLELGVWRSAWPPGFHAGSARLQTSM